MGGKTQELRLNGPAPNPAGAGAGAVVLVDGAPVRVDSAYASPRDGNGDFGAMDLYKNQDKTRMGFGISRIQLPRRTLGSHVIVYVYQSGFATQRFALESHIAKTYWLNVFNLIGFIVDPFTGAMWTYTPEELSLSFVPKGQP